MTPRFYAFRAINSVLDQTQLRRQLDQFRAIGLDSVVWHPRLNPNEVIYAATRPLSTRAPVSDPARSEPLQQLAGPDVGAWYFLRFHLPEAVLISK